MSEKEEHKIKKLIQRIDLESPAENFTDKVMSLVNKSTGDETLKDIALASLLKITIQEAPSADFSIKVINKINTSASVEYIPIISKKVWRFLIFLFGSFMVYALFTLPKASNSNTYMSEFSSLLGKLIIDLGSFISETTQMPFIVVVSTLCLSTLLLLDYAISKRRLAHR